MKLDGASKRIYITGTQGFTGRHLVPYLQERGYEVLFDRSLDINDKEDIEKSLQKYRPDTIIHLAAIAYTQNPNAYIYYQTNLIATENLLQAAIKHGVERFIFASSAAVYGAQQERILHEDLCPNPMSHYALSKYGAEQMIRKYQDAICSVIVRPFNYTGPGQSQQFVIPKIVAAFKHKEPILELGNIDVVREFNDIAFVCEAYARILQKGFCAQTLNIASGRGVSLREVVETMESITGLKPKIVQNPKFIRRNEPPYLVGSAKKLFSLVGEIPSLPLRQTLQKIYEAL